MLRPVPDGKPVMSAGILGASISGSTKRNITALLCNATSNLQAHPEKLPRVLILRDKIGTLQRKIVDRNQVFRRQIPDLDQSAGK
jgi:hypothetical protein